MPYTSCYINQSICLSWLVVWATLSGTSNQQTVCQYVFPVGVLVVWKGYTVVLLTHHYLAGSVACGSFWCEPTVVNHAYYVIRSVLALFCFFFWPNIYRSMCVYIIQIAVSVSVIDTILAALITLYIVTPHNIWLRQLTCFL